MFFLSAKSSTSPRSALLDAEAFILNTENVSAFSDPETIFYRRQRLDQHIDNLKQAIDELRSKKSSRLSTVPALLKLRHKPSLTTPTIRATIRTLKRQRNDLAPIARLPSELLSHVFTFCITSEQIPFGISAMRFPTAEQSPFGISAMRFPTSEVRFNVAPMRSRMPPRMRPARVSSQTISWVRRVTHVCHYWRFTALSDPSLWTRISLVPEQWAAEMILRSKSFPLFVDADSRDYRAMSTSHITLAQLPRIRELTFAVATERVLDKELSQPAPLLNSFALRFDTINHAPLPNALFGQNAPHLRRLELDHCRLSQASPLFRGLTHLILADVKINLTMSQFLAFIGGIPALRELTLRDALPIIPSDLMVWPTSCDPTTLPQLRMLYLDGPWTKCVNLLNNLHLPEQPVLKLSFDIQLWKVEPLDEILSAIARHCGDEDDEKAMRGLSMEDISSNLQVQGWSTADVYHPDAPLRLTLQLIDSHWQRIRPNYRLVTDVCFLLDACSLLPLRHLRTLHWGDLNLSSSWTTAWQWLSRVEKMFLDGESVNAWLLALVTDGLHNTDAANVASDSMPALRTLICRDVSFTQNSMTLSNMCDFINELDRRRCLGIGIESLHLFECSGFTEEDVELLMQIVPEVVCIEGPDAPGDAPDDAPSDFMGSQWSIGSWVWVPT